MTSLPTIQLVICGDCTSLPLELIAQCDAMITDPPYSEHTHTKAVSVTGSGGKLYNTRKRDFGFSHLDSGLRAWIAGAAATVKRWSVLYSDIESTHHLRVAATEAGATYVRTLAWIRWSMPQLSGDRPPSGREDLLIFHAMSETPKGADAGGPVTDLLLMYGSKKGRKAWNGPGNLTHLEHKCLRGDGKHRAEKPLDQALDLVHWFTDPGETVFDPFAGSGTLGVACALLGRNYLGYELDPKWQAFAEERIRNVRSGVLSDRDIERVKRWDASKAMRDAAKADKQTTAHEVSEDRSIGARLA